MQVENVVNSLYQGVTIALLTAGYAAIGSAVMKSMKPPSLGLTPRNMVLLGADIAAASMTRDMLVTKGIISDKIITSS